MRRKQDGSGEMESEWETVKEEAVTDSLYLCPVCNLLFSQAKCLSVHLKKVHQTEKANVDEYAVSMEGSVLRLKRVWKTLQRYSYKCLKCNKVIHHRSTFGQHIRVNVNRKEVSCEATDPDSPGLNFYQRELFLTPGRRKILCHTCGAAFTEKSTFLNHVEESHGEVLREKYRCEFCDYSANAPRFLRLHYERKHPSTPRSRSHVCEVCGKAFFDKIVLDEHVNYVHLKQKEFRCSLCPKVFYRPQSFHKHKRNHAGKRPHVCAKCGQSFVFPYNLKIHERLHTGEKPHKCPQCDAAFTQKNGLDLHMKKHEKREGISLKPGAGNSVVSRKKTPPVQQDDMVAMPAHRKHRHKSSKGKKPTEEVDFTAKEERVTDCLYVCPECRHPCCRESSIISHMHKVHQMEITDGTPYSESLENVVMKIIKDHQSIQYRCLKCDSIITSRLKLSHHLCVDERGQITCKTLCPDGVGLTNWQTVTFLKRRREYLCHACGTSFTDRTTFHMHVQSHGGGVERKRFICEHCPYSTNNRFYFKVHIRGQHCDEPRPRPHVCELCGKTFALRGVLMQHKQYMHVKDKKFQCPQCPKFFYRHQGLARHLRTHSGQRPWVCGTCGQGFTVKYNLKVHERLHSGEKPYQCKQCDAAFAQKNSLNVHMKKHEGGGGGREGGGKGGRGEEGRRDSKNPSHSNSKETVVDTQQPEAGSSLFGGTSGHLGGRADHHVNPALKGGSHSLNYKRESSRSPSGQELPILQQDVLKVSHASQSNFSSSSRDTGGIDVQAMPYGYGGYPDYAMAMFPSLPGSSYQFLPVTRP